MFEMMAESFPPCTNQVDLGAGMSVEVRNRLGLTEMMLLVKNIVDACVDEERGEVHTEIVDYVAKLCICSVYCNIPAPEDQEIGYAAVCGADRLYERIEPYIDGEQLINIWDSVMDRLNAKQELFASAAAKITIDMLQKVNELYEMVNSVAENFDGEEAVEAVKKLSVLATGK